jgi:predicted nuclease of predicted toxin-antitoxin system
MPPSENASSGVSPLPESGPKLLFDENLAPRLVAALADIYPNSAHVRDVELEGSPDSAIWEHAAAGGFLLVTKDDDFHRLSVLCGFPPKVAWIRLGNCSTADIAQLLRTRHEQIVAFAAHDEAAFIALG